MSSSALSRFLKKINNKFYRNEVRAKAAHCTRRLLLDFFFPANESGRGRGILSEEKAGDKR